MTDLPLANFMAGHNGTTICHSCSHIHERHEQTGSHVLTWIAGCFCGCVANEQDYYGIGLVPLDGYEPKREPLPSTVHPVEPTYRSGWQAWFMGLLP